MNIQLTGTEEFIDGKSTASLGQVLIRCVWLSLWGGGQRGGGCGFERGKRVLIRTCVWDRCNNVLWIQAAKGRQEDVKMEG